MQEDELTDQLEAARSGIVMMSVREYAKVRGVEPQLIYYYIRTGKISQDACPCCGRKVIDVGSADEFFRQRDAKNQPLQSQVQATQEVPRSDVDS
jgi:hypothetical protein